MDDLDSPESGDKDKYTAFFDKALKDYGEEIGKSIDSPADLDDEQNGLSCTQNLPRKYYSIFPTLFLIDLQNPLFPIRMSPLRNHFFQF